MFIKLENFWVIILTRTVTYKFLGGHCPRVGSPSPEGTIPGGCGESGGQDGLARGLRLGSRASGGGATLSLEAFESVSLGVKVVRGTKDGHGAVRSCYNTLPPFIPQISVRNLGTEGLTARPVSQLMWDG